VNGSRFERNGRIVASRSQDFGHDEPVIGHETGVVDPDITHRQRRVTRHDVEEVVEAGRMLDMLHEAKHVKNGDETMINRKRVSTWAV
jgi:hypothetical protein